MKSVPVSLAYATGAACEGVYRLLRIQAEPPMTRFLARELSTAHWFNIAAAQRDFGYRPSVSFDEGMQRLRFSRRRTCLHEKRIDSAFAFP